jgi:hypothetical protein
MSLAQIHRLSETVIITDGYTAITMNGAITSGMGCQASNSHHGGGTHIFTDGHAKWIRGNPQNILARDPSGCWIIQDYAADR